MESAELNRRRLRVLAPLMLVLHTVHVVMFHVPAAVRATASADWLRWRTGIMWSHAGMLPIAAAGAWIAWRARSPSLLRALGPVFATAYLVHAALCSGFDQIVVAALTPYIGYCLGIAVIVALTPAEAIVAYAVGSATMVAMVVAFQRSTNARLADLPNVLTVNVVGVALAWIQHASRRRELEQKRTIDRQREELAALNASLERRVAEQVAQLQAQVVARSGELSLALAKLAQHQVDTRLAEGAVLGDRFVVGEIIGEGGMGAVYAGVDRSSGARVAIKVIQATSSRQLDALRRFIREAGATATLTHPAVVRMIHVDVSDDGLLYQVLERVDGETLTRRLGRAWPPADAARVCSVLADALATAHANGVVHRDVKPDNVMLTTTAPGLKLLDFGIAKLYDAVSATEETTRGGGVVLGTPAFMAPEQVGGGDVGDRADVYAVGVILFRMLAGRGPFEASSPQEMMMRHVLATPPSLRAIDPSLPEAFAALVARCLDKEPGARPTAAALAGELAAYADAAGAPSLSKLAAASPVEETVRARVGKATA